ncbi:MAG TPA: hypothetical protein DCM28_18925 [Phycisphaerales bacterium]|nr:hypothetical protein [Phycisphaerales bacterium]HCD32007.1 hypothetical protein [Phycisphaerales bacterium]|tara:strand:+ start:947 stop:1351 length:405 start_codon:yes stop_codon:yes gene_type:complete
MGRVTIVMMSLLAVLHASAGQVLCLCNHEQPALKSLHTSSHCSADACGQKPLRESVPHQNVSESCVDLFVPILTYRSERVVNPLHGVLVRVFEMITIAPRLLVPAGASIVNFYGDHHPPDLQRFCLLRSTILNI